MHLTKIHPPKDLLKVNSISFLIVLALKEWLIIITLIIIGMYLPLILLPIVIILLTGRYHALGAIIHEYSHMRLKPSSIQGVLLEVLTGYPLAITAHSMKYHHLRHHQLIGSVTDPYFFYGVEKYKSVKLLFVVLGLFSIPFWFLRGIIGTLGVFIPFLRIWYAKIFLQQRKKISPADSLEIITCCKFEYRMIMVLCLLLTVVYFTFHISNWAYVIPILLVGACNSYRLILEHKHYEFEIGNKENSQIMRHTRDHYGFWNRVLLFPLNIGYHKVHHLHPNVSCFHLKGLHNWYKENHPELIA